jgi:hypothetical protein
VAAFYVASWLTVLKKVDKRAIFTAASHAQKTADYLTQLATADLTRTQGDGNVSRVFARACARKDSRNRSANARWRETIKQRPAVQRGVDLSK